MSDKTVDLYLQQGMYGPFQTKPDERHLFLGSLRERVIIALTKGQMLQKSPYEEVKQALKSRTKAVLYINGKLPYHAYSPYMKLAAAAGVRSSVISDLQFETPLGLVFAADNAVNHDSIYVQDDIFKRSLLKP
ncbi:YueI family protein [Bacillus nakamurai]|uniref:DUF1694 domain-containing protein n=1 Tax=Bacillus nakamurai TaxID=1793963 RepID=A0A150F5V6_9BACI|nr:YueI family protein [Bacillus nakamurai]KXZ17793.1 hypothetical protein AXI58_18850 [Bacillus nakamurai]MED1227701.1 YueI family protein [Bacillus nakamurai]